MKKTHRIVKISIITLTLCIFGYGLFLYGEDIIDFLFFGMDSKTHIIEYMDKNSLSCRNNTLIQTEDSEMDRIIFTIKEY